MTGDDSVVDPYQDRVDEPKLTDTLGNLLDLCFGMAPGIVRIHYELINRTEFNLPDYYRRRDFSSQGRCDLVRLIQNVCHELALRKLKWWALKTSDCWVDSLGLAVLLRINRSRGRLKCAHLFLSCERSALVPSVLRADEAYHYHHSVQHRTSGH
jgi:hypothetical protein